MILEARNLSCRRGERVVFQGVGFALGPGDALLVRGANGAGKSSLLRLICGLAERLGGDLLCDGAEVRRDWPAFRDRLHYVGHLDAAKPSLSAAENLAFWADLQGGGDPAAGLAAFALDELADLPARLLSAGQRRRLALARLAAVRRDLWLLDEPTTALDTAAAALLAAAIARHRAAGGLVIAASHAELDLPGARELALAPGPPIFADADLLL